MRHVQRLIAAALALGILTECAPRTNFSWGNYEDTLYVYYKNPSAREAYRKALTDAIDRGRKQNNVAPGLLAELGYLYFEDGKIADAKTLFDEEMQRFPESRPFLIRIMERSTMPQTVTMGGMS